MSRRFSLAVFGWRSATRRGPHRLSSANDRVAVGVIGVRGMGLRHVKRLLDRQDARWRRFATDRGWSSEPVRPRQATGKSPRMVEFPRLLDDKSIDAVVIATPHHWHCTMAIRAWRREGRVPRSPAAMYFEGRLLVEAAAKYGRILQHGTQMRSSR
jgi:predicted dehydrogenase